MVAKRSLSLSWRCRNESSRGREVKSHRSDFGQMPGVNDSQVGPSFRELSEKDSTRQGMIWSSIGVGTLVLVTGIYFLGDWLNWF